MVARILEEEFTENICCHSDDLRLLQ